MRKSVLVIGLMSFCFLATTSATTIEWVTDGASEDQPWVDLLTSQGYTVNAVSEEYRDLDETKIATLNVADLVIISRRCSSGSYGGDSTKVTAWNGLTSPLLNLNIYLARNSRWKFIDGQEQGDVSELLVAVEPSDVVFWGVPLDENNQVDILVPNGQVDISNVWTMAGSNGTLLGKSISHLTWLIQWATGVEYYVGAGEYAGGPRAFFGAGTTGDESSTLNLNIAGQQLFLNMVYEMSGATSDRPSLADAGDDKITYIGDIVQLNGYAVDPESVPTVIWSKISGPGTVSFDDVSSAVTTVSIDTAGTYILRIAVNDGTTTTTDTASIYVNDHTDDALLAHWDFDSLADANTLVDVSGNGFDGIFYSTTGEIDPNIVAGHIIGSVAAAEFSGDFYWEIPTAYDDLDPNLNEIATGTTIAVWVNIADDTGYPMIIGNGVDGWRLQVTEDQWNFVSSSAGIDVFGTYPPIDGFWHHVVAVYDGVNAKAKIYVDGILNAEQDVISGSLLSQGTDYPVLQVGSRGDGPRIWPGLIDDIQIYNYALSDSGIASLAGEGDVLPLLTAGEDQEVQYTGGGVSLDATVFLDDGIPNPLVLSWEVITVPGGVDLNDVVFDDNTVEDSVVNFPNVAGTYIFKLTGNDGVVEISDEVNVLILIPTCEDVLADGLGFVADMSGPFGVPDCYVNLYDLAAVAEDWLNCNNPEDVTCLWPY